MAMWLDYKPTRYESKGFFWNLNIRIHRDITGEMWFGVGVITANREILYCPWIIQKQKSNYAELSPFQGQGFLISYAALRQNLYYLKKHR